LKHNEQAGETSPLPELQAIVPTYPLTEFDVLSDASSVFEELAKKNPLIAKAIERIERQQCQSFYEADLAYLPR